MLWRKVVLRVTLIRSLSVNQIWNGLRVSKLPYLPTISQHLDAGQTLFCKVHHGRLGIVEEGGGKRRGDR